MKSLGDLNKWWVRRSGPEKAALILAPILLVVLIFGGAGKKSADQASTPGTSTSKPKPREVTSEPLTVSRAISEDHCRASALQRRVCQIGIDQFGGDLIAAQILEVQGQKQAVFEWKTDFMEAELSLSSTLEKQTAAAQILAEMDLVYEQFYEELRPEADVVVMIADDRNSNMGAMMTATGNLSQQTPKEFNNSPGIDSRSPVFAGLVPGG